MRFLDAQHGIAQYARERLKRARFENANGVSSCCVSGRFSLVTNGGVATMGWWPVDIDHDAVWTLGNGPFLSND
jgi:hypothetical protein